MSLWKNGALKKEDIRSWMQKMTPGQWIVLLLLGLLLAVAAMPVSNKKNRSTSEEGETVQSEIEKTQLEGKLESLLESVEGVGKVQVILMTNEKKEQQGFYSSQALAVTGVLISAQGGDDPVVVKNIQEAVMALFQVEAHKIRIMKMK